MRIEIADRGELAGALRSAGTTVIARYQSHSGRWMPHVRAHPRDGYLVSSPGYGLFHVTRSGARVRCAPTVVATWRWQRSLIGEVLPFVSALKGLETLHASAVVPPGESRAIAVAGPSGRGKSSVAAEMLLAGATLLADDVLAVESRDGVVIAHPAPGLMSLKHVSVRRLGQAKVRRLGVAVGTDAHAIRIAVPRFERPLPLAAIYILEAVPGSGLVRLATIPSPDPRLLLGTTFNFALRTSERLVNQLEACGAIASTVRVVRVRMPVHADFSSVARKLLADIARAGADGARR